MTESCHANTVDAAASRPSGSPPCKRRRAISLAALNQDLDAFAVPYEVSEAHIEKWLRKWTQHSHRSDSKYLLMTARLFEAALLCAGNYINNGAFSEAGDLLFNPRRILVFQKGQLLPKVKNRHDRLSVQFNDQKPADVDFPHWFRQHATLRITQPAAVPCLLDCLAQSGCISFHYLHSARTRFQKASETIAFLGAWSISGFHDLHRRLQAASLETRQFVSENLCGFNSKEFDSLGEEIRRMDRHPAHQSHYLRRLN